MTEKADRILSTIAPAGMRDEFHVVERVFSDDEENLSVGLANIRAIVPDIDRNKDKIVRALQVFKEKKVNMAVFPEFSLSGYFWDDETECRKYMYEALTENHIDWINGTVKPMLDDNLKVIVLNNVRKSGDERFLNSTFVLAEAHDMLEEENVYNKVFLPGIEKIYTETGRNARLVLQTRWGTFGFLTSYDIIFPHLVLEYARIDRVDAIIQVPSWKAEARRDYPGMNVNTDTYYGELWPTILSATSAVNQIWTIGCNAVGIHGVTGQVFWGDSGLWAPSGLRLAQASRFHEELLIIHNVDIKGQRAKEQDDFNYAMDFEAIYYFVDALRTFTRMDDRSKTDEMQMD